MVVNEAKTKNKHIIMFSLFLAATWYFYGVGLVKAESYDVEWTFGNIGFQSYVLNSYSPMDANLGTVGEENPTLTLELGKRYLVDVINYGAHPFDVIAKGATAGADTILLAMGSVAGSFESDQEVAWVDNNRGTVVFTLTQGLYDAMIGPDQQPGYRCRAHASTMRGDFIILEPQVPETISKGDISIDLELIAADLTSPVDLKQFADGTDRLLVVDQSGIVYNISNGQLQSVPFLDVTDRLVMPLGIIGSYDANDYDERGLLSIAFHPDFADINAPGYRKVYTYTSEPNTEPADFSTDPGLDVFNHQSVIAEWMVDINDPNIIDISTRREILRINQPQFNHNGGMLEFGHDGYLYISLGDGGAANDRGNGHGEKGNGQNINTIYGSILRIDPLNPSLTPDSNDLVSENWKYRIPIDNPFVDNNGVDEIFAYGFRNPFRFSFDSVTGELIVADVGQNNIEEIDIVKIGGNYGWNLKEGTFRFNPDTGEISDDLTGLPEELIDPVAQYNHDDGLSIIGGYVYRGMSIPELEGKYVFGDFSRSFAPPDGRLFYADLETGQINEFIIGIDDVSPELYIKGLGQDSSGELYVLASSNLGPYGNGGVVLKIISLRNADN
jgi:glucose/arabinose dehydrogenase